MTERLDEISSVNDSGNVVPKDDILEYDPGYADVGPVTFKLGVHDSPEANGSDDIVQKTPRQFVSDLLRASIEDWLDRNYYQNPTLEEACTRYGVSLEDYEASEAIAAERQEARARIMARNAIHDKEINL